MMELTVLGCLAFGLAVGLLVDYWVPFAMAAAITIAVALNYRKLR